MSRQNESDRLQEAVVKPFNEFWSSYFQHADENMRKFLESFDGASDLKQWRRHWLNSLSRSMDVFLRSPAFLEAVRHNMDAAVKVKDQANDVSKEVARNIGLPTLSDVSGLFERLHSIEEGIILQLAKIEQRLGSIEQKLQRSAEHPGGSDQ